MHKLLRLVAAGTFTAVTAIPALAIEPDPGTGMQPIPDRANIIKKAGAVPAQQMTGTVTDVQMATGIVSLMTKEGAVQVHFPPDAVRDLSKGDTITTSFTVAKADTAGDQPARAYDAPTGKGEHRMTGLVTKIDQASLSLHVKTEQTTLQLRFQPNTLRDLKEGDKVTVDMAYMKGA